MALAGSDHFVANFNVVQTLSRTVDRVLEDAQLSGILSLSGRNLKEFPSGAGRYDLADTVVADLSRNRLTEFPVQLCEYGSLETLILYHNSIRSIPLAAQFLASLTYLDLSRNQLVTIPSALTILPLEVLILNNNRIQTVPGEICRLGGTLMELDVSCNRLTSLPLEMGDLGKLRVLNARENLLSELPLSLNKVRLRTLDVSSNKLSFLDVGIRCMTSLIELNLDNNPLVFPPAKLCDRGCVHIFKSLELESTRRAKRRPQTANSVEADLLDRRRYRMAAVAAAMNGNDAKSIQTNAADYKCNMSLSTIEHRRKYRHRTIASETRYYFNASADDCCSNWTAVPNERPIDSVDRPAAAPLLQKRSPPIGEEVPPPPPSKIETTPLSSRMLSSPRDNTCSSASSNPRSPKSDCLVNGTSLVDEVMAACRESEIMTKPTKKAVDQRRGDSVDEISCILRKQQEQEAVRRRNATDYMRHVQNENGSVTSRSADTNSSTSPPIILDTASPYSCESMAIDRPSSSPVSCPTQQNRRHVQRATYSITEEAESSPVCAATAGCSHTFSFDQRAEEKTSKSPPKSARSDVIQSIYTTSPNAKRLHHAPSDQGDVHPCCPSHCVSPVNGVEPESSNKAQPTTAQSDHHPITQRPPSRIVRLEGDQKNVDSRKEDKARCPENGTHTAEASKEAAVRRQDTQGNEQRAVNSRVAEIPAAKSSVSGRQDNPRRSIASSAEAGKGQKRMTTSTNGLTRTSTSGQLSKGSSQSSLTSSASSHRLTASSTAKAAASTSVNGTQTTSATKKLSPASSAHQEAAKIAVKTISNQKTDHVGPTFHRASQAANQSRSSRSRESLLNGVSSSTANSRKAELNDRNQQIIDDMRQVLEKTLKITLPSTISELTDALADGVHLCNFVNALRPRTIPSVHVAADPATKLPAAKCRRNVENFMMGCRRLGITESQLFGVNEIVERKTLASAAKLVQTLVKQSLSHNTSPSNGLKLSSGAGGYGRMTNV